MADWWSEGRCRRIAPVAALVAAMLAAPALPPLGKGLAMTGGSPAAVSVKCSAAAAKGGAVPDLCALFRERLAAAYPGLRLTEGSDTAAAGDLTAALAVERLTANSVFATLRWTRAGQTLAEEGMGAARADADFAAEDFARFLDRLIAAAPLPA